LTIAVGLDKVFISIYESNSDDGTGVYLAEYRESLDELGIPNQVVPMVKDEGESWPYATSPQRIEFLARLRNKAMEPIQSADPDVRLENWHEFTKVIYLNDIRFEWEDIVRLIATRVKGKENEDYDVACAMDFGDYGKSWGISRDDKLMHTRLLRYLGSQRYMWNSLRRKMAICHRQSFPAGRPRPQTFSSIFLLERRCGLQLSPFPVWSKPA
jgi:hypothetical protein